MTELLAAALREDEEDFRRAEEELTALRSAALEAERVAHAPAEVPRARNPKNATTSSTSLIEVWLYLYTVYRGVAAFIHHL